jgi:carboxypeptidase T
MLSTSVQTFGPVRGYETSSRKSARRRPSPAMGAINVTNGYHDEEAVAALLLQFQTNFPALAQRIQIGSTHWGRAIWALKISDNVATDEPEPRVVIDANIHAREYAGPEVALDIIWQLLYGYTNNPTFASWVDGMEIYVIPCLNPDGRYSTATPSAPTGARTAATTTAAAP